MRKWAKSQNMSGLHFRYETYSRVLILCVVKPEQKWDGTPYYVFGRVYHYCGDECTFHQQGIACFDDELEALKEMFKFFGFK